MEWGGYTYNNPLDSNNQQQRKKKLGQSSSKIKLSNWTKFPDYMYYELDSRKNFVLCRLCSSQPHRICFYVIANEDV